MTRTPAERWRLLLGRYSERRLGDPLSGLDARRDGALEFLYGREYARRGIKPPSGPKGAGLDPTQLRALDWLSEARALFPTRVFESLQGEAVERYGLADLLKDPRVLEDLDPSPALLRTVMSFMGREDPALRADLRRVAQAVIDEITEKLHAKLIQALSGRRNRHRRSAAKAAANFDARATIRANLGNWDAERQVLAAEHLRFTSRQSRRLDWTVILCVDQSGSMTDSLIFAALTAAILGGLPGIGVRLVLFDTAVLDVTGQLDDPLSLLLSVHLGGGTDIGKALTYCEGLVEQPTRTVLALVSDFREGASPRRLLSTAARLHEARVRLLGIAALDDRGQADFDRDMGERLAAVGMNVAALTPDAFADWLGEMLA